MLSLRDWTIWNLVKHFNSQKVIAQINKLKPPDAPIKESAAFWKYLLRHKIDAYLHFNAIDGRQDLVTAEQWYQHVVVCLSWRTYKLELYDRDRFVRPLTNLDSWLGNETSIYWLGHLPADGTIGFCLDIAICKAGVNNTDRWLLVGQDFAAWINLAVAHIIKHDYDSRVRSIQIMKRDYSMEFDGGADLKDILTDIFFKSLPDRFGLLLKHGFTAEEEVRVLIKPTFVTFKRA